MWASTSIALVCKVPSSLLNGKVKCISKIYCKIKISMIFFQKTFDFVYFMCHIPGGHIQSSIFNLSSIYLSCRFFFSNVYFLPLWAWTWWSQNSWQEGNVLNTVPRRGLRDGVVMAVHGRPQLPLYQRNFLLTQDKLWLLQGQSRALLS